MKGVLGIVLLMSLHAPYQCGSAHDPEVRREDTAGDALWNFAEQLRKEGNEAARKRTLQYLVDRYPSHRFAQAAREELTGAH